MLRVLRGAEFALIGDVVRKLLEDPIVHHGLFEGLDGVDLTATSGRRGTSTRSRTRGSRSAATRRHRAGDRHGRTRQRDIGGARVHMQMVNCPAKEVALDMPVEFEFRRIHQGGGRPNYSGM